MLFTGALFDHPDVRDYQFVDSSMLAGASVNRTSVNLIDLHVFRVQKAASCVAYAFHQGIQLQGEVRFRKGMGPKLPLLGPLFGYTGARILSDPPTEGHPLQDIGSRARFNLKWMRDRGIVSEAVWPEYPPNVNMVPPFDVFKSGGVTSVDKFYRIEDGTSTTDQLIAALRLAEQGECAPPMFVMSVGDTYADIGKATYTGPKPGESVSGHGQTILAWDETRRAFGVASSWGQEFGDNGVFWVSEEFMNTQTRDKWVTQIVPVVAE